MVISKTPFRMSFFGGGTDIPSYFNLNRGAVISTTFNKYCYVTLRVLPPFFSYTDELVYSKIERITKDQVFEHPMVRNALAFTHLRNLRISYEADLPARSGLGTSSSFAVGLLNALHVLKNEKVTKRQLAEEAIYVEREMCKEAGGWQDQIAAAYGGFNKISFTNNSFSVIPLNISEERLKKIENNLFLYFTGFTRISSEIQKNNIKCSDTKIWNDLLSLVEEAEKFLVNDNIPVDYLGKLLHETWIIKKSSSHVVSNKYIDSLYDYARKSGALGGKLLGAGSGGFLLFYVPECYQRGFLEKMQKNLHIPFKFENSGSQIIYDGD